MVQTNKDEEPTAMEEGGEPKSTFGPSSYIADTPSEDPSVTCFMVPTWMGEGDEKEKWICSDRNALWSKDDPEPQEDSY